HYRLCPTCACRRCSWCRENGGDAVARPSEVGGRRTVGLLVTGGDGQHALAVRGAGRARPRGAASVEASGGVSWSVRRPGFCSFAPEHAPRRRLTDSVLRIVHPPQRGGRGRGTQRGRSTDSILRVVHPPQRGGRGRGTQRGRSTDSVLRVVHP